MDKEKREVMRNYVRRVMERFPAGTPVRYTTGQLKANGGLPFGTVVTVEQRGLLMPFVIVETPDAHRLTVLCDNIEPSEPVAERLVPASKDPTVLTGGQIAKDERILQQALSNLAAVRNLYNQGDQDKAINLYATTRLVLVAALRL